MTHSHYPVERIKPMRTAQAIEHGWPADRRKRRRAHRRKAKYLLSNGVFLITIPHQEVVAGKLRSGI